MGPARQHSKYHFNGPSAPTGKKEISSVSTEAVPSGRNRRMGRERGLEHHCGDRWLKEGVLTKKSKGRQKKKIKKKMSKGKDGSGP